MAILLNKTDEYVKGMAQHPYPLKDALADSLTAVRMRQAAKHMKRYAVIVLMIRIVHKLF